MVASHGASRCLDWYNEAHELLRWLVVKECSELQKYAELVALTVPHKWQGQTASSRQLNLAELHFNAACCLAKSVGRGQRSVAVTVIHKMAKKTHIWIQLTLLTLQLFPGALRTVPPRLKLLLAVAQVILGSVVVLRDLSRPRSQLEVSGSQTKHRELPDLHPAVVPRAVELYQDGVAAALPQAGLEVGRNLGQENYLGRVSHPAPGYPNNSAGTRHILLLLLLLLLCIIVRGGPGCRPTRPDCRLARTVPGARGTCWEADQGPGKLQKATSNPPRPPGPAPQYVLNRSIFPSKIYRPGGMKR